MALSAIAARRQKSEASSSPVGARKRRRNSQERPRERAFSPSRPIDDDDEEDDEDETTLPQTLTDSSMGDQDRPIITFPLHEREVSAISPQLEPRPAVLLILKPDDVACLTGVTAITILYGALSVFGAILQPSLVPHTVFAPLSHPIPALTAVRSSIVNSAVSLPANAMEHMVEGNTILIAQDISSGIHGLQSICPIFNGIFNERDDKQFDIMVSLVVYLQRATTYRNLE